MVARRVVYFNRPSTSVDPGTEIIAGDLLDGGGPLSADITLDVNVPDLIAAVAAALVEGTNMTITYDAGTDTIELEADSGGGGSASLLAQTAYTPVSDGSYTTTSGTAADIHATNLAVTFTAPASGKVNVRLQALTDVSSGQDQQWGLREGTTNIFAPRATFIGTGNYRMLSLDIPVTGLTPGNSYTYKWSWKTTGGTATLYYGPTRQVPIMQVWAVP